MPVFSRHPLTVILTLLISLCSLSAASTPQPPNIDPFYQPPSGFASSRPGTILRSRTIKAAFFGFIPEAVTGYQLLYRTTATNGSAIAAVTTIFRPYNAKNDRFISLQTAEDSGSLNCAPSYIYQQGANQTDLLINIENLTIQVWLSQGYIVSSPDYEGPDAAFGPGPLSGMTTLDSMRAVQNFGLRLLLFPNAAIVGTGYSGGAIAAAWAAALHPTYAPELNIKGWASGGTPANLTGCLLYLDNTLFSGLIPVAIEGLNKPSSYAAQLNPIIQKIATAFGKETLAQTNENCVGTDVNTFAGQSVLSYKFQSLGPRLPYQPTVAAVLKQQTLGINQTQTPVAPVLLYHAAQDEMIPYANASTLYSSWCANGASVHFTTYANGGHLTTAIFGVQNVVQFAASAFAGTVQRGCSQNTLLMNTLDPLALGAELEPVLVELVNDQIIAGERDKNIISNPSLLGKPV